jgi:hypothetical protein
LKSVSCAKEAAVAPVEDEQIAVAALVFTVQIEVRTVEQPGVGIAGSVVAQRGLPV